MHLKYTIVAVCFAYLVCRFLILRFYFTVVWGLEKMMNLTVVSTGIWLCLIALFHSDVFCLKKRAKGANEKTFLKENIIIFNSTVLEQAKYYKDLYHIEMTVADIAFLMKELSLVKSAYFEFGMGAQTSMSCEFAQKYNFILYAVHSSSDTIDEISNDPCLRQLIEDGQANLLKIDIGITGKYGLPLNSNDTENFHFYSDAINRIRTHVDLILVDGRFRIASVLKSLIKFPNSRILLHDYYEPYHYRVYSPVRNYAYVMESSDTFVRLRRKEEISDDMIKLGLPKFANRIQ